ncbi:MAG: nitronate monooxygenase family protein [Candidatus Omnitrophota bacterium]|nr:nitronate monooxygenase family protein [Candidatus Omnitrophota bacterium]
MNNKLKPLIIGDLEIKIPIIQGGMGVKVSTASLASAVADCGAAGTIASVGLGYGTEENEKDFVKASRTGLEREIRQAKEWTQGVVGVNTMVALSNYDDLTRTAVREKADFVVSGAGLPLRLPEFTEGSSIKLIPIVSSSRAADIIIKNWKRRYNRLPDAIVVEGPLAGGHLGFKFEDLKSHKEDNLEKLIVDVLKVVKEYEKDLNVNMPVIAAGGVFDGKDVVKFLKLGARGVQIATRFVTTFECSVADEFKELYLTAGKEDIVIIESPVGMPGRVIMTGFINRVMRGEKIPIKCNYRCLKTCDPKTSPYCIAEALFKAVSGNLDNAVVFAGSNVPRINKIVSVKELIDGIVSETIEEFARSC